jgi:hypothetical protein
LSENYKPSNAKRILRHPVEHCADYATGAREICTDFILMIVLQCFKSTTIADDRSGLTVDSA